MSICILMGHTPGSPIQGVAEHRQSMFTVCVNCGKTLDQQPVQKPEDPYKFPNPFERLERAPASVIGE